MGDTVFELTCARRGNDELGLAWGGYVGMEALIKGEGRPFRIAIVCAIWCGRQNIS